MYENITGVLLLGGKSTRMGSNKAFLEWEGKSFLDHVIGNLQKVFRNNIIISNSPELYENTNLPIFKDIYSGGPLAGIHSGLVNSQTDLIFVISCDVPFLDANAIEFIVQNYNQEKILIPYSDGFMQHLAGIYSKLLIPKIEEKLKSSGSKDSTIKIKQCKMSLLFEEIQGTSIDMEKKYPEYTKKLFLNINTPEDYKSMETLN